MFAIATALACIAILSGTGLLLALAIVRDPDRRRVTPAWTRTVGVLVAAAVLGALAYAMGQQLTAWALWTVASLCSVAVFAWSEVEAHAAYESLRPPPMPGIETGPTEYAAPEQSQTRRVRGVRKEKIA